MAARSAELSTTACGITLDLTGGQGIGAAMLRTPLGVRVEGLVSLHCPPFRLELEPGAP